LHRLHGVRKVGHALGHLHRPDPGRDHAAVDGMIERKAFDTSQLAPVAELLMTPCTPEQERAAMLATCARAGDAADAAILLQMLGLIESPPPAAPLQRNSFAGGDTSVARATLADRNARRRAAEEADRRARGVPVRSKTAQCGTPSGYQRHRRLHEVPCEECVAANTEYQRAWRRGRVQAEPTEAK
jgi:hypothetical protein